LEHGQGIPKRLLRRVPAKSSIILNGTMRDPDPSLADFLIYPRRVELPATGLLGVLLDAESEGEGVGVQGFMENSGAKAAGMEEGDRIVKIGPEPINGYADVRIALIGSRPGQKMPVEVLRDPLVGDPDRMSLEVELH
jgi:S1-C subfamily serine protease